MGPWLSFAALVAAAPAFAQEVLPEPVRSAEAGPSPSAASRDDVPWYVGKPVGLVSLVAADGGLPPEYLQPLLRVRLGEPLNLGDIREDIALLYRAASFAVVEAEVETWPAIGPNGEPLSGVHVGYRVVPSATVKRIEVDGPPGPASRLARRSLGVHNEDPIFPEDDLPRLSTQVVIALANAGWVDAKAHVVSELTGPREVALTLKLDPGVPRRYGEINVVGDITGLTSLGCRAADIGARMTRRVARRPDCGVSERRIRRWLRRGGVKPGSRVELGQMEEALVDVRRKLVRRGWLQSRIGFHVGALAEGQTDPSRAVNVEGGPRLVLQVDRSRSFRERVLPTAGQLQEVLGFFGGERVDELAIEESTVRLESWLDARGYVAASAELDVRKVEGGNIVSLVVDPGRKHRLSRIEVDGTQTLSPGFVGGAMKEAAMETLGEGRVSREGIEKGLVAVEGVYRGAGHLNAEVTLLGLKPRAGFEPWLLRRRRPVRTVVQVEVDEGSRTHLVALEVVDPTLLGGAIIREAYDRMVGEAYNPGQLDQLERDLVGHYQSLGYLNAQSDLQVTIDEHQGEAEARLLVRPGSQVRLRSVVVRGNRRVRRRIITRELALEIGEPITPDAIAESRSALYELGLFRVVSPDLVGDDDRTRDLIIQVDERRNILLEGGGRIATDQGVLATARATHRNIAGFGHSLSMTGQLGYGWLADEWVVDTQAPVWRVATRYAAPWVPGQGHELIVEGLLREVAQEPTFRIQRSGVRLGIRSEFGERVETFIDYNAQVRQLESLDPGALLPGDPWLPLLALESDTSGELRVPSENRLQAGPELLVLVDARNDRFNPTQGAYFSAQGQVSDGLWSDMVAIRGDVRLEFFLGVGPVVMNWFGRAAGGRAAGASNTLPIEDRFYLGGAGSMRGFQLNSVGPANFAARPDLGMPVGIEPALEGTALRNAPGHWVWTGGDSLFQTTLELRLPLSAVGLQDWDTTQVFVFTDVGQVSLLDVAVTTTSSEFGLDRPYRYGVGAGVRVATPIGPAAIAIGVNPEPVKRWEEPTFLPHLTLGEL